MRNTYDNLPKRPILAVLTIAAVLWGFSRLGESTAEAVSAMAGKTAQAVDVAR